ncbi:putative RNA-directed DNA polymerase from transposon BS [Amphibalanus amphitrite]|uniref:Putative RNA-directed DNA polymerase from transposon BS n=1 Tax=Amphibalanus amphitrite TaxID=1232801 RepID=A0A6A4X477_AMPAM|nr:putative RNA-directed DNA polymerase from transposon BS [Amphibalanus amphitrite]
MERPAYTDADRNNFGPGPVHGHTGASAPLTDSDGLTSTDPPRESHGNAGDPDPGPNDTGATNPHTAETNGPTIIGGDVNAHNNSWDIHQPEDAEGHAIEAWATERGLTIANSGQHTRVNPSTGGRSTPDLTLVSGDLAGGAEWETGPGLGSDHLPIYLTLPTINQRPKRKGPGRFRQQKADWEAFRRHLDTEISKWPSHDAPLHQEESRLTGAIITAAKRSIPFGNGGGGKPPFWNESCQEAVDLREGAQSRASTPDHTADDIIAAREARQNATNTINREKTAYVNRQLEEMGADTDLWRTIKILDGRVPPAKPAVPIQRPPTAGQTAPTKAAVTDREKADLFCQTYAAVSRLPKRKQEDHAIKLSSRRAGKTCECGDTKEGFCSPFSRRELQHALSKLKSGKSPGPDMVSNDMLRQLSPTGETELLRRVFQEGLPQGSVMAPLLWLIYCNDLDEDINTNTTRSLYADDTALLATGPSLQACADQLQPDLDQVARWLDKWKVEASPSKCVFTTFSLHAKEVNGKVVPTLTFKGDQLAHEKNPTFLGLTLDSQLTFTNHIEEVKKRMAQRRCCLTALAGRSYGCDQATLRAAYIAYIRSVADYGAALYSTHAAPSVRARLEAEQHKCARVITGCIRLTNSETLITEAGLPPLAWMAKEAGLADLPREPLALVPEQPPWTNPADAVTFRLSLPRVTRRDDPPAVRKAAALEAIAMVNPDCTIWSDGSAKSGTRDGGGGALIQLHRENREVETLVPAGSVCSSMRAELAAMLAAFTCLLAQPGETRSRIKTCLLCTDSLSGLQLLQRGPEAQQLVLAERVWAAMDSLGEQNTAIILQWVPGHADIAGNEAADRLANRAAAECAQSETPIDLASARTAIRQRAREMQATRAHRHPHPQPTPGLQDLPRWGQVTVSQLRTGHCPLARATLHRLELTPDPLCRECGAEDTVRHLLTECPAFATTRRRLWGGPLPSLDEVLSGPAGKIVEYIRRVPAETLVGLQNLLVHLRDVSAENAHLYQYRLWDAKRVKLETAQNRGVSPDVAAGYRDGLRRATNGHPLSAEEVQKVVSRVNQLSS